jgi:hypothetical protein
MFGSQTGFILNQKRRNISYDKAAKRFSVLIQILKVEQGDRKPFGSDLNVIETVTGFFIV